MAPATLISHLLPRQETYNINLQAMQNPNATHAPIFYATTTPFAFLMVLFFAARIYSRVRPVMLLYWDDLFLTLGFVSFVDPHQNTS
jgi:hypothetical protein